MSRTDKMHTWWVVHLVFVQTVKDIRNMNIVLDSRHKKLIKKLFGKVLTYLYTDLNSIFLKNTWWKLRDLRKRYKTSFLAITFDLENRFLHRRCLWFRITKLQMKINLKYLHTEYSTWIFYWEELKLLWDLA